MKKPLITILMLTCSNMFMNAAWYGHLKFKHSALWLTILVSWGIAFFEYCFQVPANRIGSDVLSVTQLKVIQEVLSLTTFAIFSVIYLNNKLTYNHAISFALIIGAAYFAVRK